MVNIGDKFLVEEDNPYFPNRYTNSVIQLIELEDIEEEIDDDGDLITDGYTAFIFKVIQTRDSRVPVGFTYSLAGEEGFEYLKKLAGKSHLPSWW